MEVDRTAEDAAAIKAAAIEAAAIEAAAIEAATSGEGEAALFGRKIVKHEKCIST